jgi:hypothetical protein
MRVLGGENYGEIAKIEATQLRRKRGFEAGVHYLCLHVEGAGIVDLNGVWKMDWVRPEKRKRESERKRGVELKEDEKKPRRCWIRKKVHKPRCQVLDKRKRGRRVEPMTRQRH